MAIGMTRRKQNIPVVNYMHKKRCSSESKNCATIHSFITLTNVGRFSKFNVLTLMCRTCDTASSYLAEMCHIGMGYLYLLDR